eukprot:14712-Heterococcus_DN1.PRE.2
MPKHAAEEQATSAVLKSAKTVDIGVPAARAHADVKAADKALQQLQEAHSKIKPGSSWADRKTCAAVDKLEQLPFREVTQAIIAIKDVEEQWRLANWLTEFVGEAITAAVGWAGKLVNGSEEDWCSDTADIITEM